MYLFKNDLRTKIKFVTLICVCVLSLGLCYIIIAVSRIKESYQIHTYVSDIRLCISQARQSEKNFLLEEHNQEVFIRGGKSHYLQDTHQQLQQADTLLNMLEIDKVFQRLSMQYLIDSLRHEMAQYRLSVNRMSSLFQRRGFKDIGLEGRMRTAIHHIEQVVSDKVLLLTLRRHEKDFLMRKDVVYVHKFKEGVDLFRTQLETASFASETTRNEVLQALAEYQHVFLEIVDIEEQVGLTEKEGVRKEMNHMHLLINNQLQQMKDRLQDSVVYDNERVQQAIILVVVLFNMVLIFTFFGLRYLFRSVFIPLEELQVVAEKLSRGNPQVSLDVKHYHQTLRGLGESFKRMTDELTRTIQTMHRVADGDMDITIQELSEDNILGQSLHRMTEQLKQFKIEEEKRHWVNKGYAHFSSILQQKLSVSELSYQIVRELVRYVNASQGGLFMDVEGGETLTLVGCVAYDKRKFFEKTLFKTDGLIGQCWLEGETIHLTEIPDNYLFITSGLGEALPRTLLLVPVQVNGEKLGVFELASFRVFQEYEIVFIEKVCENIASTFMHLKMVARLSSQDAV